VVANGEAGVAGCKVPKSEAEHRAYEVKPVLEWPAGSTSDLHVPGSVAVAQRSSNFCEFLVCDNEGHRITRHRFQSNGAGIADGRSDEVLLQRWLDLPDGLAVDRQRRWLAVSNHGTHSVLIYEYLPSLHSE